VASTLVTLLLLSLHFTLPQIFLTLAGANALVAVGLWRLRMAQGAS
jgi:hypothetical protein